MRKWANGVTACGWHEFAFRSHAGRTRPVGWKTSQEATGKMLDVWENEAMVRRKKAPESPPLHERYNPAHPLLRELVLVHVCATDGTHFDMLLTRVPGIGEELSQEDRIYRILRVQHEPINDDGRARFGWHAFIDAELLPPEDE